MARRDGKGDGRGFLRLRDGKGDGARSAAATGRENSIRDGRVFSDGEDRSRARERPSKSKTAIGSLRRARRFTRAESMFTKLGNIPTEFKELLERCFYVFLKIIRIPIEFEQLLEMLLQTPKKYKRL